MLYLPTLFESHDQDKLRIEAIGVMLNSVSDHYLASIARDLGSTIGGSREDGTKHLLKHLKKLAKTDGSLEQEYDVVKAVYECRLEGDADTASSDLESSEGSGVSDEKEDQEVEYEVKVSSYAL